MFFLAPPAETFTGNKINCCFWDQSLSVNPLTSRSDQQINSPNDSRSMSRRQVMRIYKINQLGDSDFM